jgi:alpha-ketoglutarate-dependent taurine dioxygenase
MEEHPAVGGDTAWVSGYGLYDELSPHMQKLLEGLHAVHTSRLQYDTLIVSPDLLFPSLATSNILTPRYTK